MDAKPYWFLVGGLLLLYLFVLVFYALPQRWHRRHPGGYTPYPEQHPWLGPGGTRRHERFSNPATLTMIGVDWCPHCTKAKPIFESLGSTVTIGGSEVALQYLDGEKDKNRLPCEVGGFPTFCFQHDGKTTKYNGPRSAEGFQQFLQSQLSA
jgi:hypothetical protein